MTRILKCGAALGVREMLSEVLVCKGENDALSLMCIMY